MSVSVGKSVSESVNECVRGSYKRVSLVRSEIWEGTVPARLKAENSLKAVQNEQNTTVRNQQHNILNSTQNTKPSYYYCLP